MAKKKDDKTPEQEREEAARAAMAMTADTVGVTLLKTLVQELKLLPDVWPKLSKAKQDDVIDRLRDRVNDQVKMAVHLIAAEGRTTLTGQLAQVTIKDGVKAVVELPSGTTGIHDLFDAAGRSILLVLGTPAAAHTGGMQDVKGESDQRGLDLGHEYDPKGDGKGMPGDGDVIDGEVRTIEQQFLQAELDAAYQAGRAAYAAGEPKEACPETAHELVARWTQGWTDAKADADADATAGEQSPA